MYEVTQKNITMRLEEFRTWIVPKGWIMKHVNGCIAHSTYSMLPGADNDPYFEMRVVIEKE